MDYQHLGGQIMTMLDSLGISAPWMRVIKIDPVQWGRWYSLLVKPNRASKGLYILHDRGKVVTATPAYARSQMQLPPGIDDPEVAAAELYAMWQHGPVVVLEREALRSTFDIIQRDRTDGDDIFSFLLKTVGHLSSSAGLVIHPNPFVNWRGTSPAFPRAFAQAIAPPGTARSVVIAVYDTAGLWASLLLGFESGRLELVTTLPLAAVPDWRQDHQRLLPLAESQFAPVTLGVFCPLEVVQRLGVHPQSWPRWLESAQRGEILCTPSSLAEIAARVATKM
jgi:hypothetical protein